jgi:hypothetical protein
MLLCFEASWRPKGPVLPWHKKAAGRYCIHVRWEIYRQGLFLPDQILVDLEKYCGHTSDQYFDDVDVRGFVCYFSCFSHV